MNNYNLFINIFQFSVFGILNKFNVKFIVFEKSFNPFFLFQFEIYLYNCL